jgi:hypothetical protein
VEDSSGMQKNLQNNKVKATKWNIGKITLKIMEEKETRNGDVEFCG